MKMRRLGQCYKTGECNEKITGTRKDYRSGCEPKKPFIVFIVLIFIVITIVPPKKPFIVVFIVVS